MERIIGLILFAALVNSASGLDLQYIETLDSRMPATEFPETENSDVYVFQQGQSIIAETADGRQIATSYIKSDASGLF